MNIFQVIWREAKKEPALSGIAMLCLAGLFAVIMFFGYTIYLGFDARHCHAHGSRVKVIGTNIEGQVRYSWAKSFDHAHWVMYENDVGDIKHEIFLDSELEIIE